MSLLLNSFQEKWLTDLLAYLQSRLQIFLIVLILGSLAVAGWRYQHTVLVISEARTGSSRSVADSGDLFSRNIQPLNFYTGLVEKRDIFSLSSLAGANPNTAGVSSDSALLASQDIMSHYLVQGIVYDGNPMAIIKDKQSNKTYFLHRSETLNGATLVDIRGNRVIFNRDGEMMELIKK